MRKAVAILSLLSIFTVTISMNIVHSNPQNAPAGGGHGGGGAMAETPIMGKILETMDGGGYTYLLLQIGPRQVWVAIRQMKVTVGENIALMPGIEMYEFTAKSINRTFDIIIFSDGPISQQGATSLHGSSAHGGGGHGSSAPHGGAGGGHGSSAPHGSAEQELTTSGSSGIVVPKLDVKVEKASGANAYTVMELYEKRIELNEKDVTVKGKVVKVTPEIMGKNWLHLQDGTGYEQNNTNDIVITTKDLPTVGDVVTISGKLYSDKDFGSGYKYSAIIEEAKVSK